MSMSLDKPKKKGTFHKIENGMILTDDEGEIIAVGLPKKVRTMIGGKVGAKIALREIGGELAKW